MNFYPKLPKTNQKFKKWKNGYLNAL